MWNYTPNGMHQKNGGRKTDKKHVCHFYRILFLASFGIRQGPIENLLFYDSMAYYTRWHSFDVNAGEWWTHRRTPSREKQKLLFIAQSRIHLIFHFYTLTVVPTVCLMLPAVPCRACVAWVQHSRPNNRKQWRNRTVKWNTQKLKTDTR